MITMRGRVGIVILALAALLPLPALAVTGTVSDENDEPMKGATVCLFHKNMELRCEDTDARGKFELPTRADLSIRVMVKDYLPVIRPAEGNHRIKMTRSPVLFVRLVDAVSGKAIENGEILVVYPTSVKKGPFPVGRAGVRITRVLRPGDVRILVDAKGYRESMPRPVVLEAGLESELIIELVPVD